MKKENKWQGYSRSEILESFIDELRKDGMDSYSIGIALAQIWIMLPEEIE